ncbi:MAG TPA: ActS/PrrB/RegB family redox-sensitive histidine kinase [Rhizobiales bacterium]|nr:ActS/PrrB/RegB family redox-sensitive histidine kinase [Hyphomicrobiales bacterium]
MAARLKGQTDPAARLSFFGGGLRLRTLVFLRWLAVAGQAVSIVLVRTILEFDLPFLSCLVIIALSVALNVGLTVHFPANTRLKDPAAGALLAYDILQLALLLYLTGGLTNPFAFLFLVPVTVSASALPLRYTLALGGLTINAASLLVFFHFPLPWFAGATFRVDTVYLAGIWASLVISLLFITFYSWRIADETRRMSDALAATELVLAREQQFSALDGLAAAAAHELGTPLGTIAITTSELRRELAENENVREDLDLLREQVNRCRTILGTLTNHKREPDELLDRVRLGEILEEIAEPYSTLETRTIEISSRPRGDGCGPEPERWRSAGMSYGLGNMLANALDYAASRVSLAGEWTAYEVSITISDDGPGFAENLLQKLGEPFISTRPEMPSQAPGPGSSGMGLGFFIAKTLLERSGARVRVSNAAAPDHGAVIEIIWPRSVFENPARPKA